MQTPLCPYLNFYSDAPEADASTAATTEADDGNISLAPAAKRAKTERKRKAESESALSGSAAASGHSLTWSGLLSPSFLSSLLVRSRALLASTPSVPFVALTVFGFDDAITSWREKQHQVWMGGSGPTEERGGGENHYTLIIMPESQTDRDTQQYVCIMMLGELDQTH
jgi:hypothetical protein